MKTWIKRSLYGLLGATIVAGGLSACGARHERHGFAMGGEYESKFSQRMVQRVSKELELNASQQQRLSALGERMREQRRALIGNTTDPRAELQSLVAGAQFDRRRAQAIIDEKTDALRGKIPEVIAAAADFFDSLNPAQQQKLRQHLQPGQRWFGHG